ncbi:hypothetical protein yc1106_07642 [Curvularia clavata]|uniref:Uncharacterized protein n=1 Tax=Curvularia clavata TaxID=95742 RepID=A0A9Q8ZGN9_CURCL|nr:hypothetical protein yc1106_07642 [Curvularia clavata]
MPECSLCQRTGRKCEYTDPPDPLPTAAEFAAMRTRLDYVEERLASSADQSFTESRSSPATSNRTHLDPIDPHNLGWSAFSPTNSNSLAMSQDHSKVDFPVALFLDIDYFVWAGMRLPHPSVSIPMEQSILLIRSKDVLALLNQGNVLIETSRDYFDTIHSWMPILSKKRMDLGISVHNSGSDLAMLFLAMK